MFMFNPKQSILVILGTAALAALTSITIISSHVATRVERASTSEFGTTERAFYCDHVAGPQGSDMWEECFTGIAMEDSQEGGEL